MPRGWDLPGEAAGSCVQSAVKRRRRQEEEEEARAPSPASVEILAFLLVVSGWVLVSSTLPTDYWKVSSIDGTVITTATFWSNLWKTCVTDSTGVSNCKDFPSMLALDGLQGSPFPPSLPLVSLMEGEPGGVPYPWELLS
ncbi:Claudin-10, partial [Ophiophagus hannah]